MCVSVNESSEGYSALRSLLAQDASRRHRMDQIARDTGVLGKERRNIGIHIQNVCIMKYTACENDMHMQLH